MIKRIKARYERLKQWQKKPFDYEFTSTEVQHCNNCAHDFTGNYCPYCSQRAGEGPIGWGSVRRSVMDIWGLGSRSLPNTLGQLLLRPGYLISDYISGKRQESFPPVKMLFFVSVVLVFWIYYLLPLLLGEDFDVFGGYVDELGGFSAWTKAHFVWTYFAFAVIYIIPTWILFRYAPCHTRHTLPQGFFIQVYLLVLNLILSFFLLSPLFFLGYNCYLVVSYTVLVVYYFIAYKQLFGYGIWGTLWRLILVLGASIYLISALMTMIFGDSSLSPEYSRFYYAGGTVAYAVVILVVGWVINLIIERVKRQKKLKK